MILSVSKYCCSKILANDRNSQQNGSCNVVLGAPAQEDYQGVICSGVLAPLPHLFSPKNSQTCIPKNMDYISKETKFGLREGNSREETVTYCLIRRVICQVKMSRCLRVVSLDNSLNSSLVYIDTLDELFNQGL